jgi:RNA polymerase sigma-70 factor (ECF subfamily)
VEEYEHYLRSTEHNSSIDAASVYSAVEITEILERGIARLNDRQRTIYRMNIFEGKKVAEISATLNINYKSVENRLGSARSEIRQYMRRMLA